jgi:hypothetical protein
MEMVVVSVYSVVAAMVVAVAVAAMVVVVAVLVETTGMKK